MNQLYTAKWANNNTGQTYIQHDVIRTEIQGAAVLMEIKGGVYRVVPLNTLSGSMLVVPQEETKSDA